MYEPHWLNNKEDNEINVYSKPLDKTLLTYSGFTEVGKGILLIELDTSVEFLIEQLGDLESLVNRSVYSYLCTYDSFNEWGHYTLSEEINCRLAIETLTYVIEDVLESGTPKELQEVCKCVCLLSNCMTSIKFEDT